MQCDSRLGYILTENRHDIGPPTLTISQVRTLNKHLPFLLTFLSMLYKKYICTLKYDPSARYTDGRHLFGFGSVYKNDRSVVKAWCCLLIILCMYVCICTVASKSLG